MLKIKANYKKFSMNERTIPIGLQDTCFQVFFFYIYLSKGTYKNILLTSVRSEESWRG